MLERPELGDQAARGRLQQRGHEDVVGTEAHAEAAQPGAHGLVQLADVLGNLRALQNAERFDETERDAAGKTLEALAGFQVAQRLQHGVDMGAQPQDEARLDLFAVGGIEAVLAQNDETRGQHRLARDHAADDLALPAQSAIGGKGEVLVCGTRKPVGALGELTRQGLLGSRTQGLDVRAIGRGVRCKAEALQLSDMLSFDKHVPCRCNFRFKHRVLSQPSHQYARPPVDEALGEPVVQCVGQTVFYAARHALPMGGIRKPVTTVGDEGPGADMCNAVRQRIDVAVDPVGEGDLAGKPVVGNDPVAGQMGIEPGDQVGMVRRRDLAVIGDLADIPEQANPLRRRRDPADGLVAQGVVESGFIGRGRGPCQALFARRLVQRAAQALDAGEVERAIAPLENLERVEAVAFQRLHQFLVERIDPSGDAERAVAGVAAGASADLPHLGRRQHAVLVAVELADAGEGDVIDVEIEAHADRVGGDQVLHVAVLEQFDLGIAGARAERAENDGGAAVLAANQLGDRIDLRRGEGDHGRACRQTGDLLLARIGQDRHARAGDHVEARQQAFEQRARRRRAEKQRLQRSAHVEDAVGENVTALQISGELHLINGNEIHDEIERHGLHRRHPVAGIGGDDLFLARDQRDLVGADPLDDAAVDLAREQAQRQADDARFARNHPLDCEVGLAGVGRAEDRRHRTGPRLRWQRGPGGGGRAPGRKRPRLSGMKHCLQLRCAIRATAKIAEIRC